MFSWLLGPYQVPVNPKDTFPGIAPGVKTISAPNWGGRFGVLANSWKRSNA